MLLEMLMGLTLLAVPCVYVWGMERILMKEEELLNARKHRRGPVSPLWKEYYRLVKKSSMGKTRNSARGALQLRASGVRDSSHQGTRTSRPFQAQPATLTQTGSASRQQSRTSNPDYIRPPRPASKSSLASAGTSVLRQSARQSEGRDLCTSSPDSVRRSSGAGREAAEAQEEAARQIVHAQNESSLMRAAIQRLRQERGLRWEPDEAEEDGLDDHFIFRPTSTTRQEDQGETQRAAAVKARRMTSKMSSQW